MEKRLYGAYLIVYLVLGIAVLMTGSLLPDNIHPHLENYNETVQEKISLIDPSVSVASFTRSCFISLGTFIITLVLYGSCCLVLEKKGLLKGFAYMLTTTTVLKFIAGFVLLIIAFNKTFAVAIRQKILDNFHMIRLDLGMLKVQMFLEETYNCCGIDSYRDYRIVYGWEKYPGTCCKEMDSTTCNLIDKVKFDGCGYNVMTAYHYSWIPLGILCAVTSLIEIVGVVITLKFLKKIAKYERPFVAKSRSHSTSV